MYKARRSKYFVGRYEGVIKHLTPKYVHASIVNLDKANDELDVKIERAAFVALDVKKGMFFNMYFQEKNGKKQTIIEQKKFALIPDSEIKKEADKILTLLKRRDNT